MITSVERRNTDGLKELDENNTGRYRQQVIKDMIRVIGSKDIFKTRNTLRMCRFGTGGEAERRTMDNW